MARDGQDYRMPEEFNRERGTPLKAKPKACPAH